MKKFSLVLGSNIERIKIRLCVANIVEIDDYYPSYNIVFGSKTKVIINNQTRQILEYEWGIKGLAHRPNNLYTLRAEGDRNKENDPNYTGANGIFLKTEFRHILMNQRCLILADAFVVGLGTNTPYLVYLRNKNRPFAIAGIWNINKDFETDTTQPAFAIMTTAANRLVRELGNERMPAILPIERESAWLRDSSSLTSILDCLAPFPDHLMNAYQVSTKVNDPLNNDLSVIQPIGEPVYKEYKTPVVVHKKEKRIPSDYNWADEIRKSNERQM